MKIRLMGTREEITQYMRSLPQDMIIEASRFYPNRGSAEIGRLYLEIKTVTTENERKDIKP